MMEEAMSVKEILDAFNNGLGGRRYSAPSGVSAMRAEESDYGTYAERYISRGDEEEDFKPDWPTWTDLWRSRDDSPDAMAELLAETLGVAHDEALAWVNDY